MHPVSSQLLVAPTNPQESDVARPDSNGDTRDGMMSGNGDSVAPPRNDLASPAVINPFHMEGTQAYVQKMTNWLRLFIAQGQVVELRALGVVTPYYRKPHVVSGFFDFKHLEEMVRHALKLSDNARGVYFTLNPLNRALLSRRQNRIDDANDESTHDVDVLQRHWLLIDADPQRISGVSATDAEKAKAWEKILTIRRHLHEQGWPDPVLADSGNGYHLLYRVDLPTQDGDLVKRVLHALAEKFDDEQVKVDRSVFNPSRITKLYGTMACKGDNTPERPHRCTSILDVPKQWQAVSKTLLEALAAPVSSPPEKPKKSARAPASSPPEQTKMSDGAEPVRDLGVLQERARAYLEQLPPAISGEHGHNRTFHAACVLTHGFGLSVDEALPILQLYNLRCQPPWTNDELFHKLQDAHKKEGPRGYLLGTTASSPSLGSSGFQAHFLDSAELQTSVTPPQWLVKRILVARQPAVIGGPKKVLKTSLIVDLAISLGSGKPFLNRFPVPQTVKVLVLSGESGQAAILDTARRVCAAKGIELSSCNVLWGFALPSLSSEVDLAALTTALIADSVEVVIIDPLYLCLLGGNAQGRQASNLFDMGPLLLNIAQACLQAGTTPILVHHARKQNQVMKGKEGEPLDLEDLAYSGVAEFARQWMLISRRERFDAEVGEHKLWLSVGGSAGHAGLYALHVQEGVMDDHFGGRKWLATVEAASKAIQARKKKQAERKQQEKEARKEQDTEQVLSALTQYTEGRTAPDLAAEVGLSKDKVRAVLHGLLRDLKVVQTQVSKGFGSGKKPQPGWMLWRQGEMELNEAQKFRLRAGEPVEDVLGPPAGGTAKDAGLGGG